MLKVPFAAFLAEASEAGAVPQLGHAFAAFAASFRYDKTIVFDPARFGGDMRAAVLFFTEPKTELATFANKIGYVEHPAFVQASASDRPYLADALREQNGMTREAWAATLPAEFRDGEALALPVHRAGRLVMLAGCGGSDPDTSPLAQAMLHTAAHVFFDRVTSLRTNLPTRPGLTNRESECMRWVGLGKTDREISEIVGISARTVRYHLQNAKTKLGAESRVKAIAKLADTARRTR